MAMFFPALPLKGKMKDLHAKIIEEEIVKPQIKKQVGWLNNVVFQSPWNRVLAFINCSFDLNEEGHESEDLDKLSSLYGIEVKTF